MTNALDMNRIPTHVAIIMDGNGRWAQQKGLPRLAGHKAGVEALRKVIERADQLGVGHLTVYAFSTENWKRPQEEVNGLMTLLQLYIKNELGRLHKKNVRIQMLGELSQFTPAVKKDIEKAMEKTKANTGLTLNIALNYGSRDELVKAAQSLASQVKAGQLEPEDITEDRFESALYSSSIPDPDLLIRTSGEIRLSNFLLWQLAYTEFYFTDVYWPDFGQEDFDLAIGTYQNRNRRFGGI